MKLTIYRGTHEVGGTMIEMRTKNTRILIDAGYPLYYRGKLIDDGMIKKPYKELLELGVIPNVEGLYRWDSPRFDAVLISHGHSDHFGLLNYIHPDIPVYLSEAADKLIEMNLAFPIKDYGKRRRNIIPIYESFSLGDFAIKFYYMDHSAFQANAFEIKCEGKRIIYTGDFRGHGRRQEYLERFMAEAEKCPDLLLIEGTTLGRNNESELTERELEEVFHRMVEASEGIVLCQTTGQNVDRILSFYRAAKNCGKIFVMDIYTANLFYELNKILDESQEPFPLPSLWRPNVRVFYPVMLTRKMEKLLGGKYASRFRLYRISKKMIGKKQNRIVMMVRPSMLADIKPMKLQGGSFVYSLWQAYRDKPYQVRFENYLKSIGLKDRYLHTSGHAFEKTIKKVIEGLSPKEIVPIHTFCPETFYEFSQNVSIMQDGVPFEL